MLSPEPSPVASPRRTLQQIEQEVEENLKKADPAKAIPYVELHSLRKKQGEKWVKYPISSDNSEFGVYGIGLFLYFNFLKKMSLLFAILSIIAIPSLVSNCIGDGLDASSSKLLITTLANQPKLKVVVPNGVNLTTVQKGTVEYDVLIQANINEMNNYSDLVDRNVLLVAVPDLIYSIVFFFFIIYLRLNCRIMIESLSQHNVVITDFAAEVSGFPAAVIEPTELIKHFEQFGQVVEVCLARNYHNTLMYNKEQARIANKITIEQKRLEYNISRPTKKLMKLKQQRNDLIFKTEKKLLKIKLDGKSHDEYPSLKAYVVFDDFLIADRTIKQYSSFWRYSFKRIFCNCCWDIRRIMPEKYRFQGNPLVLKKTTAPSDILWENLDLTWGEGFLRKLISAVIVFFLMLITFIIIFAAQLKGAPSTANCGSGLTYSSVQGASTDVIDCFCSQYNTEQIFTQSDLRSLCWDYGLQQAGFQAISVASSFIIVMVNFLLKLVLVSLGKFERYPTLTAETLSSMLKVFAAMFFNTALITLLISARFGGESGDSAGIVIAREIGKIIPPVGELVQMNKDQYPNDLDRLWYTNVGNKIIYTWIINVVSPHLIYFCLIPIISYLRRRNARNSFIQRDMNLFSIGPSFEMIPKYALALNTIFVTLFYCSGMPILLFFGAASLFLQYWVEKYLILRFYCRPPSYNHDINTITLRIIPAAIIFHLAMGIYTYGSEDIFMKEISFPQFGNGDATVQFTSTLTDFNALLLERIQKIIYCFVTLLILAALYFMDLTFFRVASSVFKILLRKRQVRNSRGINTTYQGNGPELRQQGLTTYEIRGNANYRDLVNSIDTKEVKQMNLAKAGGQRDELIKLTEVECLGGVSGPEKRVATFSSEKKLDVPNTIQP